MPGAFCSSWAFEHWRPLFEARGHAVHLPVLRYHDKGRKAPPELGTTSLLDYADDLDDSERRIIAEGHEPPTDALSVFKKAIAREYANATTHNRLVNRSRALCRLVAGLATLASVLATLALVATVSLH